MWIEVFGLSCLLSILEAQKLPTTPTFNPECTGMKVATNHLQAGIKRLLQKSSSCQPNPHCTGVKCTWSGGGDLEIDLHHCTNPVKYHVYLNAPEKGVYKENITLQQGDDKELMKGGKIHVTELSRKGNIVTTTVKLELCRGLLCLPPFTLLDQKFCVRMQNCSGFNASTDHYKPCYKPTGPLIDHSAKHTFRSTPSGHSTTQTSSLGTSSTEPMPGSRSTDYPSSGNLAARNDKRHRGDSKKLSTAAIIGICAASMFAILIVLAAGVYWKKYHHRSRLRAAYYNDISMHDPLYEDFGPEVA